MGDKAKSLAEIKVDHIYCSPQAYFIPYLRKSIFNFNSIFNEVLCMIQKFWEKSITPLLVLMLLPVFDAFQKAHK